MYRNDQRRLQYFNGSFDALTAISVQRHMDYNNISNTQAVWFENLKWVILASAQDIADEYKKSVVARANSGRLFTLSTPYQGPIHGAELEDFGYLMTGTIACIWQAEAGTEFILSDSCFGSWEGGPGIWYHNFFVVSPRFAIVLVNKMYMFERLEKNPRWTSMFDDSLHDFPETEYKKDFSPSDYNPATDFTLEDVFKYKRIVVPKETVFKVNSITLDNRPSL